MGLNLPSGKNYGEFIRKFFEADTLLKKSFGLTTKVIIVHCEDFWGCKSTLHPSERFHIGHSVFYIALLFVVSLNLRRMEY